MRIYDHTGKKYGTWTVIKLIREEGRKYYLIRCECGDQKTVSSGHILRPFICRLCNVKNAHNAHKGEKNGRMTCLGYAKVKKGHGYLILCDCGRQYTVDNYAQFSKNYSCKACCKGIYPGKRIGYSIVIRRTQRRVWEKKCDCGTIFTGRPSKTNCGCITTSHYLTEARKKIGLKFHKLTIKGIARKNHGHIQLLIKCKCGNEFIRNNGHEFKSKSCGCSHAAPRGEKASGATLKNCEVISMRELYEAGVYSIKEISNMLNKTENYTSRILLRDIWKHI